MATALIAMGSNLGDRQAALDQAVAMLAARDDLRVVARSSPLQNAPIGGPEGQDLFINAAVKLETSLPPISLLHLLHSLEARLGRHRRERWAARSIDLDLLLYDRLTLHSGDIQIPHPRMAFRRFVLEPAVQIAAEMIHPQIGWTIQRLWEHLLYATTYIAMIGLPGTGKKVLAESVANRIASVRFVSDPLDEVINTQAGVDAGSCSGLEFECELLQGRAEALVAAHGTREPLDDGKAGQPGKEGPERKGDEPPRRDSPVISDFWIEQSRAYAAVSLAETEQRQVEASLRAKTSMLVPPKLLVWLDSGDRWRSRPKQDVGAETRESQDWERLGSHLEELACQPGRGPWLRLDASQPEWALTELIAAIQAMQ